MPDIDLSRHAVIEASAGTGKTFAMVELAVRLLTEATSGGAPLATIDDLLLVTFTEKAAGELQDRLRRRLGEAALEADAPGAQAARRALDGYERAGISTIHAFCHQVLRTYAFENREPFVLEQTDDQELRLELLREHMRREWQRAGPSGSTVLRHAGFPHLRGPGSEWEDDALSLLARYNPAAGDRILPEEVEDEPLSRLHAMGERLRQILREVRAVAPEPVDVSRPADHPLYERMRLAKVNARSLTALARDYLLPLLALAADAEGLSLGRLLDRAASFDATAQAASAFRHKEKGGWQCLYLVVPEPARESLPELRALGDLAAAIEAALGGRAPVQLLADTVRRVARETARVKQERGLITFDDMVSRVRDALCDPERGETLARALRARYRFAIVDEFQDTDSVQWEVFRRLFAEGGSGRLFVVGDPKQAIYGFRGADVRAYLAAREWLLRESGADSHGLTTNYRSSPALIEALNWLFARGEWFPPAGGIAYSDVEAAPPDLAKGEAVRDSTARTALTLVETPDATRAGPARRSYARFIAAEIGHLLGLDGAGPRLWLTVPGQPEGRALRPDDIAILVQRGGEAAPVEDELRRASIPYSRYKQGGLWSSPEAGHIRAALASIASPDDPGLLLQALLSRFFRAGFDELRQAADLAPEHPIRQLHAGWVELAERRDWPRLFHSLLEDTPLLLDDLRLAPDQAERRATNYRHVLEMLQREAEAEALDLTGLVELLTERCEGVATLGEGEDLQRIETDRGKVQILTMHAAKGLEFPVVFVAGGFSARASSGKVLRYYDTESRCWVHDLTGSHRQEAREEEDAANRRLLYVALTRAATKLYLPRYPSGEEAPASRGPLYTVVRACLGRASERGVPASVATVSWPDAGAYRRDAAPRPPHPPRPLSLESFGRDERGSCPPISLPPAWDSPELEALGRRVTRVHSYTSLQGSTGTRWRAGEDEQEHDEADSPLLEAPVIPPGPDTGTLVHGLMEALVRDSDPTRMLESDAELHALVREHTARWLPWALRREEEVVPAIGEMLRRGLTTPLPGLGCSVVEVPSSDRFPEVEFLLPVHDPLADQGMPEVEVVAGAEGSLLHGYIDLILRRDGHVWLVDWKTNLLPEYTDAGLEADMAHHGYTFQCRLYALALDRRLRGGSVRLGGGCYVYLRGLGGDPPTTGFRHLTPEVLDPTVTAARLIERAASGGW